MSEKPIFFSTPMVQAILEGTKTQTRRVVKPQPNEAGVISAVTNRGEPSEINVHDRGLAPYQPGDILWVRERWCNINKPECEPEYYYYADTECAEDYNPTEWKWRPSIHMPREAARIFLRVTDVRVQRLCQITEADAISEGVTFRAYAEHVCSKHYKHTNAREVYQEFWNTLYAQKGYSWNSNPWVWVHTFERIKQNLKYADQSAGQDAAQRIFEYATP